MLSQLIANGQTGYVEKFVEKFGRMWKKMENYSYFCGR